MIGALLLATVTALPFGVWPLETGEAELVVDEVEFYLLEPEESYGILAILPLNPPLRNAGEADVRKLAKQADKLGATGVLLLGEMTEKSIPTDPEADLPTTGRYSIAVFIVLDGEGAEPAEGGRKTALERRRPTERGRWRTRDGSQRTDAPRPFDTVRPAAILPASDTSAPRH